MKKITAREVFIYLSIFVSIFITAKFGQYLFVTLHSSAVIWPPVGIAFASVILFGYPTLIPIILAITAATLTADYPPLFALGLVVANTLQPFVGAYCLRRLNFEGSLERARDAFVLLGAALLITMIAPTLTSLLQTFLQVGTAPTFLSWMQSWGGGAMSVLIVSSLMLTWLPTHPILLKRSELVEMCIAFSVFIAAVLFLFWSPFARGYGLFDIYVFLAVLFWIALRMEPRFITLALFLTTALAFAGTILVHPTPNPIANQLLSDEIFIEFIAVIFLIFSAVAEERRTAARHLKANIDELQYAVQRISSEDRAKSEFIAILAHELRNPLAPVMSTLEWLELQPQAPDTLLAIQGARQHTLTMRRLLDDLLDVARVSQQRFNLQLETIALRELITRCIENADALIRERNQTFIVSLPSEQVWITVDPVRFEQITTNLLTNACKYTDPGGRIELNCTAQNDALVMEVRDTGLGISARDLTKIFEPFRQVRSGSLIGSGLGIGLSLTKRLVEMHGGTISAASAGLGLGSSFVATFPLPHKELLPVPSSVSMDDFSPQPPSRYKILLVDDNAAAADGLGKLLKYNGHTVSIVYNGKSAIEAIAWVKPQIVLLDIGLPDIDGYEVARQLRSGKYDSTIIALTGYGQEEDKQKAKTAGFDHHLTKPIGIAELEAVLADRTIIP